MYVGAADDGGKGAEVARDVGINQLLHGRLNGRGWLGSHFRWWSLRRGNDGCVVHAVGGDAIIIVGVESDLLTTDRSHEDHGTKLTNVVSKFNELAT